MLANSVRKENEIFLLPPVCAWPPVRQLLGKPQEPLAAACQPPIWGSPVGCGRPVLRRHLAAAAGGAAAARPALGLRGTPSPYLDRNNALGQTDRRNAFPYAFPGERERVTSRTAPPLPARFHPMLGLLAAQRQQPGGSPGEHRCTGQSRTPRAARRPGELCVGCGEDPRGERGGLCGWETATAGRATVIPSASLLGTELLDSKKMLPRVVCFTYTSALHL